MARKGTGAGAAPAPDSASGQLPAAQTPNLDRLASESIIWDNAFSCSYPTYPHRTDVITGRYDKPIAPANITINGGYYPTAITGQLDLVWSRRNRLNSAVLSQWDDVDETPEANQTTTVKIYDQFAVLIKTEAAIAGTSFSYTLAAEIADAGFVQNYLTVELFSDRDGELSPVFSYTFQRIFGEAPTGMALNLVTVGSESSADITFDLDELA